MGLNEAQKRAANHFMSPCMVIAGPGSGKTTVLINRIRNLVEVYRVKPDNILVLTYTKAAAEELERRYSYRGCSKTGASCGGHITFGTFHAICYHILKSHFHLQRRSLISEREKNIYINPILKNKNIPFDVAEEVLRCISLQKNGFSLDNIILPYGISADIFVEIQTEYAKRMQSNGKIDFDDMVNKCLWLFTQNRNVLRYWQRQFTFILVDEFQDCNGLQYAMLKLLAGKAGNLFVVGDDDQSIYGFRGAKPGIMQQFIKDFPEVKIIFLDVNYRSRQEIVAASQKVISKNKNRFEKNIYAGTKNAGNEQIRPLKVQAFSDKMEQYEYLSEHLRTLLKKEITADVAVIFRTNKEIQDMLPFLDAKKVPYTVKGVTGSKYKHFTVKDLAAFFQLAIGNTNRFYLLQIMNKPERGIERSWITDSCFSWESIRHEAMIAGEYETAQRIAIFKRECMQAGKMSPYLAINWVRKIMGYDKWLCLHAGEQRELLKEWMHFLDEIQEEAHGFANVSEWLSFVKSRAEEKEYEEQNCKNGVQLMTMHTAKGLEFSYVFIPNVNEGNIPHGKKIDSHTTEEERRLFYVAMTRAKTALEILYLTGTKEHPRLPSTFLNELWEYKEGYSSDTSSSNS